MYKLKIAKCALNEVISYFVNQHVLTDDEQALLETCEYAVEQINKGTKK